MLTRTVGMTAWVARKIPNPPRLLVSVLSSEGFNSSMANWATPYSMPADEASPFHTAEGASSPKV